MLFTKIFSIEKQLEALHHLAITLILIPIKCLEVLYQ